MNEFNKSLQLGKIVIIKDVDMKLVWEIGLTIKIMSDLKNIDKVLS